MTCVVSPTTYPSKKASAAMKHPHQFQMYHPNSTPIQFTGQASWVEKYGFYVWEEVCDRCRLNTWYTTALIAEELPTLQLHKSLRVRYLRAVLKTIITDFAEQPDVYKGKCPVIYFSTRFMLV